MTVLVQKALMQYLKGIYLNTFVGYRNMSVILFQYIEWFYNKKRIYLLINCMVLDTYIKLM